jgi:hypothetical protein
MPGRPTGHRTPDAGRPQRTPGRLDAPPDTGHRSRGHRTRGHWTLTPDTGRRMLLRTGQADKARPAPDILGHHAERLPAGTPNRVPADGACGARRPMQARREATCQCAKLPIALSAVLGRFAGQAAPRRTALLGRFRVERRAAGSGSSVMASASAGGCCGVLRGAGELDVDVDGLTAPTRMSALCWASWTDVLVLLTGIPPGAAVV